MDFGGHEAIGAAGVALIWVNQAGVSIIIIERHGEPVPRHETTAVSRHGMASHNMIGHMTDETKHMT